MELGVDAVELRLKNMVTPAQMPYANPAAHTYDCGDFARMLRGAQAASDWNGYAARKTAAETRGLRYGRGIACYVEITGSAKLNETVHVAAAADGSLVVHSGTQAIGQGLWTSYAQLVAERLGIDPQSIRVVQGDSDLPKTGGGAGGSRCGRQPALAARRRDRGGAPLSAHALEAAAGDLESARTFRIAAPSGSPVSSRPAPGGARLRAPIR